MLIIIINYMYIFKLIVCVLIVDLYFRGVKMYCRLLHWGPLTALTIIKWISLGKPWNGEFIIILGITKRFLPFSVIKKILWKILFANLLQNYILATLYCNTMWFPPADSIPGFMYTAVFLGRIFYIFLDRLPFIFF